MARNGPVQPSRDVRFSGYTGRSSRKVKPKRMTQNGHGESAVEGKADVPRKASRFPISTFASGRRLTDADLHKVLANYELAREALTCRQQLFWRGIAGDKVVEDKFFDAGRFR
jgi:hypothetical protein